MGETEAFFIDPYLVLTDRDLDTMYVTREHRAADWREARFGIAPREDLLYHAIQSQPYLNTSWRRTLPPGSDRCWARGIWVPVTWGCPR